MEIMINMKKNTTIITGLLLMVVMLSGTTIAWATGTYTVSNVIGHKFTEESWAIRYDVLSKKLVEDLTPGNYSGDLDSSIPDQAPYRDAIFYIAYMNLGQVQTVYMAFDSYSNDNRNMTYYGVSPYQIIQQHYRTAAGKHVIVQNAFTGLVAYKENGTLNGVPDRNDSLYFGDSMNNQLYKYYLNRLLVFTLGYYPFDMDKTPSATPKVLTKSETSDSFEYRFGMDYSDLFIVWYPVEIPDDVNEISKGDSLLGKVVAFSELAYLNFTYTLSGALVEDKPVNVTLTTEYDIGPINDLWIVNDPQDKTEALGGNYYYLFTLGKAISHYNSSDSILARLSGSENIPGFSLAVSNYARIINIEATVEDAYDTEVTSDNGTVIDGDQANENVTSLDLRTGNKPAYKIDFASKPDYTLNGETTYDAPVKLFPFSRIRNPIFNKLDAYAFVYLNAMTRSMIQARIELAKEKFSLEDKQLTIDVTRRNVFYTICFPEWGGQSIYQDPTFTAYADPGDLSSAAGILSRIDGFGLGIFALAGLGAMALILKKTKYNK